MLFVMSLAFCHWLGMKFFLDTRMTVADSLACPICCIICDMPDFKQEEEMLDIRGKPEAPC